MQLSSSSVRTSASQLHGTQLAGSPCQDAWTDIGVFLYNITDYPKSKRRLMQSGNDLRGLYFIYYWCFFLESGHLSSLSIDLAAVQRGVSG